MLRNGTKKTNLRRGFLKEANEYAAEFRSEMNLMANDPICPFALAKHLSIAVTPLSNWPGMPIQIVRYFSGAGRNEFSAMTIQPSGVSEIIYNDACGENRQRSSVMHEIAHIVIGHPMRPPIAGDGCRNFDPTMELEANEFAYAVLIPPLAALRAVERFDDLSSAAKFFGVSVQLLRHRVGRTNAKKWAQNRRRF